MSVGSPLSAAEAAMENSRGASDASTARSIRVCHIASGDRWAGAEVQLSALLRALKQIDGVTLYAIFLNKGRPADEARKMGAEVCVLNEAQLGFFDILDRAGKFLAGKHIDVLHSHRYKENLLAAMLARRCHIPAHVTSQHGAPEPFKSWRALKQGAIQALDRQVALRATDRIISVSNELRNRLVRDIPAAKIITIHNGIDEATVFSRFSPLEAKDRLGLAPDAPVVGMAGRLEPIKRLDIFLRAAAQISSEMPSARFVIAGDGSALPRLRELAASLGIFDHVLFLGHRKDVYDVIRALDIFVFCSDHEGLPMALLETLYLETPVVARPVGGIAEVIEDGVSGVFVRTAEPSDLAAACTALLRDEPRRKSLAEAGRAAVIREFTAGHAAEQTAALYRSLKASW